MSVEASTWALNLAPVPLDSHGKPNDSCAFVLVGLANHAGPDGRGAFPSVKTLVRYTRKSERTVQTALARLEAEGIIRPGDPDIVAAHIKRADRRPRGWDLALDRVRTDLDEEDLVALEPQFPGLRMRVEAERARQAVVSTASDQLVTYPVDTPQSGVQPLHPVPGTGCNQRRNGVQPLHSRGAAIAPEPYLEPSKEPPPTCTRACTSAREPSSHRGGGVPSSDDVVDVVLARIGPRWQLTAKQRRRLAAPIRVAIAAGWSPARLGEQLGGNPDGVRAPYAVLRSRLEELTESPPALERPPRPPHCGQCHDNSRHRESADGLPYPCPVCHPDPRRRALGAEFETSRFPGTGRRSRSSR